ncbi:MAG: polysaccharide biosynthesis C-terminal domain-containing protein, partial [Chitinophagaceae bacterium]
MLAKAKTIASSDLVKVSFLNAIATVVRMLTGLISVKVVATIIGPPGIAVLGQLNNFSAVVLSLANGGITAGMTKYIAENAEDDRIFSTYLSTGFRIAITLTLIASLVLIFGAGYFSRSLLLNSEYKAVFIIFGLTLIFFSLNTLLTSIINGFREYKKYVIVNIAGSIIGLLFSVILSIKYGLYGALISSVTFQSVVFLITIALVSKSFWLKWKYFTGKLDPNVLKKLSAYSLMAIT